MYLNEHETESIKQRIETDKIKIKANLQLLPYTIMESLVKDIFALFTSKKRKKKKKKASK